MWIKEFLFSLQTARRNKHFLGQQRLCCNTDVVAQAYFLQNSLPNGRSADFCRAGRFPVIPVKPAMGRVFFSKSWVALEGLLRHTLALSRNNTENNGDFAAGKLMPSHCSDVNAYSCVFILHVSSQHISSHPDVQCLWKSSGLKQPFLVWSVSEEMVVCFRLICGFI